MNIEMLNDLYDPATHLYTIFIIGTQPPSTTELYMNNFVGTIPAEIGGLKNLISLDLFHNNLTGFIPPSLSKLSNIRFMRLNGNNLTGRIPRDLTKLRNLKIIDVSNNDLCGTFPTWGSFSKLSQESFMNNPRLDCIAQGKVGSGFDVSSAVYESHRYVRFSPNVISSAQILGEPGGGGSSTPSMIDVMENTSSSHQNHRFQESPAHNPVRRHTCKSEPVLRTGNPLVIIKHFNDKKCHY